MQNKNNRWSRKPILATNTNKYAERFHPSVSQMKAIDVFKDMPIVGFTVSAKGTYYFYVLNFEDGSDHMSYSRLINGEYEKLKK